jgi:hypothetical protein
LPVYCYISAANLSLEEVISFIDEMPKQTQAKTLLRRRIANAEKHYAKITNTTTPAGKKKLAYYNSMIKGDLAIPTSITELNYCLSAFCGLTQEQVSANKDYILDRLYRIYSDYFNNKDFSKITQRFRYALCWIDEALNMSAVKRDNQ